MELCLYIKYKRFTIRSRDNWLHNHIHTCLEWDSNLGPSSATSASVSPGLSKLKFWHTKFGARTQQMLTRKSVQFSFFLINTDGPRRENVSFFFFFFFHGAFFTNATFGQIIKQLFSEVLFKFFNRWQRPNPNPIKRITINIDHQIWEGLLLSPKTAYNRLQTVILQS